jgi:hypothetical protein
MSTLPYIPKLISRWVICLVFVISLAACTEKPSEPVRIGILNSLSGIYQ